MSDSRSVILKPVHRNPSVLPDSHDIFYIFFGPSVSNRKTESSICVQTDSWQPDLLQFSDLVSRFNASNRYLISYLEAGTVPLPKNVDGLNLKSIAIIGDTHHLCHPISTLIDYLENETYNHIFFFGQPAHHCLFAWSGIKNLSGNWPKNITYPSVQASYPKRQSVSFFGNANSPYHPRRGKIFYALKTCLADKNIPFDIYPHMAEQEWVNHMSQGLLTVVSSLNAQPTPQIFNAIASGTFCLVDRLSSGSNIYDCFEPGLHFDVYDSVDHLLELIDYYLARPALTQKLSEIGQIQALRRFSIYNDDISTFQGQAVKQGQHQTNINISVSKLFTKCVEPIKFKHLIPLYEFIQEVHRVCESVKIAFYADNPCFVSLAASISTSLPRVIISFYSRSIATIDRYALSLLHTRHTSCPTPSPPIHVSSMGDVFKFELNDFNTNRLQTLNFFIYQSEQETLNDSGIQCLTSLARSLKSKGDLFLIGYGGEKSLVSGEQNCLIDVSEQDLLNSIFNHDYELWKNYLTKEEHCRWRHHFFNCLNNLRIKKLLTHR